MQELITIYESHESIKLIGKIEVKKKRSTQPGGLQLLLFKQLNISEKAEVVPE